MSFHFYFFFILFPDPISYSFPSLFLSSILAFCNFHCPTHHSCVPVITSIPDEGCCRGAETLNYTKSFSARDTIQKDYWCLLNLAKQESTYKKTWRMLWRDVFHNVTLQFEFKIEKTLQQLVWWEQKITVEQNKYYNSYLLNKVCPWNDQFVVVQEKRA